MVDFMIQLGVIIEAERTWEKIKRGQSHRSWKDKTGNQHTQNSCQDRMMHIHRITESQIQRKTKEIQTEEGIIETKDASDNQEQRANCPI